MVSIIVNFVGGWRQKNVGRILSLTGVRSADHIQGVNCGGKKFGVLTLAAVALAGWGLAQDEATRLAAAGWLRAVNAEARVVRVDVKQAGGSVTQQVFKLAENCQFATQGFGVLADFKPGDAVQIEYVEEEGGTNDVKKMSLVPRMSPQTATSSTPPPAPEKKKSKKSKKKK